MTIAEQHIPVLLNEAVDALNIGSSGFYVDATFGRGGHSRAILAKLDTTGRLYAVDQDVLAVDSAEQSLGSDTRFTIQHGSFQMLQTYCEQWAVTGEVDGLLIDLGVSSPQIDDPERGFSFQANGPLDMRMDTSQGSSAAEWLNSADEMDIADVIFHYGEEKNARRIARRIVETRTEQPLQTTFDLASLVESASRKRDRNKHPATRTFQAVRIFINHEFDALKAVLEQSLTILKPGGRLVVIAFHSLEDRIVKRFMREQAKSHDLPRDLPLTTQALPNTAKLSLFKKPIKASDIELQNNPRARSAIMRIAERLT